MSSSTECKLNHDNFCFICGVYLFGTKGRNIDSPSLASAYKERFKCEVKDRNKNWSPSTSCVNCSRRLIDKTKPIKFASAMIWKVPENHPTDCFFCNTLIPAGANKKKATAVLYANVKSVKKPTIESQIGEVESSSENEPEDSSHMSVESSAEAFSDASDIIPTTSEESPTHLSDDLQSEISPSIQSSHDQYQPGKYYEEQILPPPSKRIQQLTQPVLNDLVRDLNLTKYHSELITSRFQDLGIGKGK